MAGMIFQTHSGIIHGYLLFLHINNSKTVSSGLWGKACCFRQYPFIFPVFPAHIPAERIDMYVHIRRLTMYKEMPQEPPRNYPHNTLSFHCLPHGAFRHSMEIRGRHMYLLPETAGEKQSGNIHPAAPGLSIYLLPDFTDTSLASSSKTQAPCISGLPSRDRKSVV